jgi:hypothetical protein
VDTGQKTESLLKLIEDIRKDSVALPEFQRDFVWDVEKTYDLFDSFVRDIFVGSLIYGVPSFEITVRELDARPRNGQGSRRKLKLTSHTKADVDKLVKTSGFRLLLDGQQRATSIFRALTEVDPVYFVVKNDADLSADVKQKPEVQRTLEDVLSEFSGSPPKGKVSILLSDVFKYAGGECGREAEKAELASKYDFAKTMERQTFLDSPEFATYLHQAKNLENLLRQEKLVAYYLLDTDAEKFALFFERSNSLGVQLDFIDILAAKLYVGFNLREEIEKFENESNGLKLARDGVVRVISYLVSQGREIGRKYILETLSHHHFTEHWSTVISLYQKVFNFLFSNKWIIHQEWIPYSNMIIPIMLFLRVIPKQDFANVAPKQLEILRTWWWRSIFSRRYSSAAQTYLLEDANLLEEVARGNFEGVQEHFNKFTLVIRSTDDLLSLHKKYDAVYKGVFNLLHFASGGLPSFFNSGVLVWSSALEDHHIFPKDYLKSQKNSEGTADFRVRVDCVANRTLVPKFHNLKFGAKPPSTYLKDSVPGNDVEKSINLEKHFIDKRLVHGYFDDKYEEFLKLRAERILEEIAKFTNLM